MGLLMCPAGPVGGITDITTTPDDQNWMRLAEEAFGDNRPPTDGGRALLALPRPVS